ncbi:restriction endonuclease subunit S [Escherichia coli]|uniref:Restriction endonuclease subunit S n=4 Tax=Escherichia TaxID=561 RepID=A0A2K3TVZ0_ECOLX|nr:MULTISPECIES: restriction endonuclease subunit S [Escherichia]EGI0701627.1 restriction endonuclease subunit S [Escherichia coli]EGI4719334.1 restriction endonuclease subunit S [Escherichia coli]EGO5043368.1 restriction endonuclease subunit S [Escherichia coli]EGO6740801.1 restriction endonuclease subunit S [Escherichia coli]EGO6754279.1 restriction endonuclease subunit S [Escherichia coli]
MGSKFQLILLDNVAEVIDSRHKTPNYTETGYPMVRVVDIKNGELDLKNTKRVTKDIYEDFSKGRSPQIGDLIISRVGSYGNISYVSKNEKFCLGQNTAFIIPNEKNSYLYYALISPFVQQQINDMAVGAVQKTISLKSIKNLKIPYPELNIRNIISKKLRVIDNRISTNDKINQTLEKMSQTLFKSWFVDFDPVIDNALDAGNPIPETLQSRTELRQKVRNSTDFKPLPAEIRSLFPSEFEETELGWVPKGWTLKSVAKSININPSLKLPKNKIAKYVDMKSLPTQGYSISDIIEKPYSGGAKFQNNDTLFARITPCLENGKTGFVDFLDEKETAFGSTEFIVMRGTPQVHYLYVACLARESNFRLHAIQNMIGSSGRQRVQNSCFDSFYIAIPTPAVMSLFSGKVSSYFDKMYFCNLENKSLTALRDTLLPKLISGELSLEDLPDLTTDTEAA